ncbi:helix-turn-helix transcriptional regulator [Conyzicola sp.]|uniref:helix-turn-helix transcriptional regulator n=1 Tax=Conyzicola sp. TaxID=1969404 RepID=UPI00398A18BC
MTDTQDRLAGVTIDSALLLAERKRIARDLNEHVLQRLFCVGLELEAVNLCPDDAAARAGVASAIKALDHGIVELRVVLARLSTPIAAPPELDLTLRERQLLRLISTGMTNREMADELGLAEKTVKNYVSGLFSKLGVTHRAQAAVVAVRLERTAPRPPAGYPVRARN